jgi:hypothetical protein
MREGIDEETKVAGDECFNAKNDLRKSGKNEQREKNPKTRGREYSFGEGRVTIRLHTRLKPAAPQIARRAVGASAMGDIGPTGARARAN